MASNGVQSHSGSLTSYCAYVDPNNGAERIGHLDESRTTIQPLAFASGTPVSNLYQVIEAPEETFIPSGEPIQRSSVKLLAPISGRDVLCVGKNYAEHAVEFHKSGYDSSDKTDQPTHPVIFTKRSTSIIADGEDIFPHPKFTETLDYEGELGVIIGKPGFQITEENAMDHVWGYTIINDVTARERQRDHKQFYIGKSPDTFCPMGPVAIPAKNLEKVLRVQTHVNGNLRQNATTDTLIFSVPFLVMTLSEGQTLMPGDVLATGTPAGVGFGQSPPTYLQPGDEVVVRITGLGKLTNRIGSKSSTNPIVKQVLSESSIQAFNTTRSFNGVGLTQINNKPLNYLKSGTDSGPPAVFVHGLGGTVDFWTPLIKAKQLDTTHSLHLFDLEGHGLSPTSPLHKVTITSLAEDVKGVFDHAGIKSGATLFAHSMGCLVAVNFVLANPGLVSKLVLLGPPPSPLPEAGSKGAQGRAALVRQKGMAAVVDAVVTGGTSKKTKEGNPVAIAATRLSLLGQDPEGYAKGCGALAGATDTLDFSKIQAEVTIITGSEDGVSPPALVEKYAKSVPKLGKLEVLQNVGHWHVFEDVNGVANAL